MFSVHLHSVGSSGVVKNLPRNQANVNARKNMFDPYIHAQHSLKFGCQNVVKEYIYEKSFTSVCGNVT